MILVTGGSGFIGGHVVERLLASGHRVRVLSREQRPRLPGGGECVVGDLLDSRSLPRALEDVCCVVHLAASVPHGRTDTSSLTQVNVQGTRLLAVAAGNAGVERFIHCSSAGVYGDRFDTSPAREADTPSPNTAYERSKLAGEESLREALAGTSVRWIVLRPSGVYGPGRDATLAFLRQVARRRVWMHGPATVLVHPTLATDVVTAIQLALKSECGSEQVFNIGGECVLEYQELIVQVGRRVGHVPRQVRAPRWSSWPPAAACSLSRVLGVSSPQRLQRVARRVINRSVDTSKARAVLGFVPASLSLGLDETVAWALRNHLL